MKRERIIQLDFIRSILIILVILVHIVHFGNLHPDIKSSILAFLMPTFLMVTGFLVNINKSIKEFSVYLLGIVLPYVIMVCSYMVISMYLPVRDGITVLDAETFFRVLLITSIGPYWFFRVMIVCGICYYIVFHLLRNTLLAKYVILGSVLLVVSLYTPFLSTECAVYYFIGVGLRQFIKDYRSICIGSLWTGIPLLIMVSREAWRDWGMIYVLFCVICFGTFSNKLSAYSKGGIRRVLLYIGRNTLPIYIFHPIFTMMSKYTIPVFQFDSSGVCHAVFTTVLCVAGSLCIAQAMDKTRLSYIFAHRRLLR